MTTVDEVIAAQRKALRDRLLLEAVLSGGAARAFGYALSARWRLANIFPRLDDVGELNHYGGELGLLGVCELHALYVECSCWSER